MKTAPMQLDFSCLTCFQLSAIFQGRSMFTCEKREGKRIHPWILITSFPIIAQNKYLQ